MSAALKKSLKIILPIILGVLLVWYSLSKVSFSELIEYAKNANYWWIALGILFGFLSHLSRAYRWLFMFEPMGYNIKLGNSFMAVLSAYLINYTIPRAGEVARASIITNYDKVPFDKTFGTIVAERVADVIVMLGIILVTLFLQFEFIYTIIKQKLNIYGIVIGILGLAVLILLFTIFIKQSNSAFALKIRSFLSGLIEGATSILKMKKKWPFIFHTLFIWAMYILMFYVTTFAIKGLHGVTIGAILLGFISATFSIAATNGGVGSYPIAVSIAFSLYGIAEEPSMAFGWIMWASQTLMLIVFGGLSLLYLPIYNRKY